MEGGFRGYRRSLKIFVLCLRNLQKVMGLHVDRSQQPPSAGVQNDRPRTLACIMNLVGNINIRTNTVQPQHSLFIPFSFKKIYVCYACQPSVWYERVGGYLKRHGRMKRKSHWFRITSSLGPGSTSRSSPKKWTRKRTRNHPELLLNVPRYHMPNLRQSSVETKVHGQN